MSSQITTAFVEQYKSNVMDLVQQKVAVYAMQLCLTQ